MFKNVAYMIIASFIIMTIITVVRVSAISQANTQEIIEFATCFLQTRIKEMPK